MISHDSDAGNPLTCKSWDTASTEFQTSANGEVFFCLCHLVNLGAPLVRLKCQIWCTSFKERQSGYIPEMPSLHRLVLTMAPSPPKFKFSLFCNIAPSSWNITKKACFLNLVTAKGMVIQAVDLQLVISLVQIFVFLFFHLSGGQELYNDNLLKNLLIGNVNRGKW